MTTTLTYEQLMALFLENRKQIELVSERQEKSAQQLTQLFQETAEQFKETDRKFQEMVRETDRRFQETDHRFQETDHRFQELDRFLKESSEKSDRRFQETDKEIRKAMGLFTSQWGKLIEALVKPDALQLFQERGFQVHYAMPRVEAHVGGKMMELDLLLENGQEVIVVEVKTTLKVGHVKEFLRDKLSQFVTFFPRYQHYKIYGAVAAIEVAEGADKYAYRHGLFVLGVSGGVIKIKNAAEFTPKTFGGV